MDFTDPWGFLPTQEHKVLTHLYNSEAPQPPDQTQLLFIQLKMWCPHTSRVKNHNLSHVRLNSNSLPPAKEQINSRLCRLLGWTLQKILSQVVASLETLLHVQEMAPDTPNPAPSLGEKLCL